MGDNRKDISSGRLKQLEEQLGRAEAEVTERTKPRQRQPNALGFAFRIATELIAAVAVGVGLGWLLDYWLETKPIFLVLFFFAGTAAGVMNVYRVTKPKNTGGAEK